jgi:hypothetical protein
MGVANAKAYVDSFAKLDLDTNVVTQIGEALSNNDMKLFESLCDQLLSNNTVSVENKLKIKELMKVTLDGAMSGNTLQMFTGDTMASYTALLAMFMIVLALVFRDGVPLSLIFSMLLGLLAAFLGLNYASTFAETLKKMRNRVDGKLATSLVSVADRKTDKGSEIMQQLLTSADCGELVSRDVQQCAKNINAIRCMHVVTEVCKDVCDAISGSLAKGTANESFGLNATKGEALAEVAKMEASIDQVFEAVNQQCEVQTMSARQGGKMLEELEAVVSSVEFDQKHQLFKRPTFLLTASEKERKNELEESLKKDVKEFCKKAKTGIQAMSDVDAGGDFDHMAIHRQCSSMVKMLCFSPELKQSQMEAVQNAIEVREKLDDELVKHTINRGKEEKHVESILKQMRNSQATFELQLQEINAKISQQKLMLQGLGQGTLHMYGTPPADDPNAMKAWNMWQDGKWNELIQNGSYSVTRGNRVIFSITVDSDLTPKQKQGAKLMDDYIKEADTLKDKHLATMTAHEQELSTHKALLDRHKTAEEAARQRSEEAKAAAEPSWHVFAAKHPIEFNNIQMLYNVKECIVKVAQWMFHASIPMATLKIMLNKLENHAKLESGFSPDFVLTTGKVLQAFLTENNKSPLAFVASVGERELKQIIKPRKKNLCGAKDELTQFNEAIEVD